MDPGLNSDEPISDPLRRLPAELVLRILDFCSAGSLASLTRTTQKWHSFIDDTHQNAIYSSPSKTTSPPGSRDLTFLDASESFTRYFDNVSSWKDLCKRQTLLRRNWNPQQPITRETVTAVERLVWRFKPDFRRRLIISTYHHGGLSVADMDRKAELWELDSTTVRPFAHLEYQDGTFVFDREGDVLEVWRTDLEGLRRGEFRRVAVLPHDSQTRGFQLSYNTLCVASSEGKGYVYDMRETPTVTKEMDIEHGAIGHIFQDETVVVYSMGKGGYHVHEKATGDLVGKLVPENSKASYHIPETPALYESATNRRWENAIAAPEQSMLPRVPGQNRTTPLRLFDGPLPHSDGSRTVIEEDEWGAGMLNKKLFVGVSRAGRVCICPDWRKTIASKSGDTGMTIVECDSDGSSFDFGGWLSLRDHRILFEIQDQVYVLGLTDEDLVMGSDVRPSFTFANSLMPNLAVPISFMALYDDCIMATYGTLIPRHAEDEYLATKAIRVLSFAPDISKEEEGI